MKGRPEQSFLDTFSERFMNHVRQVNIILLFICLFFKNEPYIVISHLGVHFRKINYRL